MNLIASVFRRDLVIPGEDIPSNQEGLSDAAFSDILPIVFIGTAVLLIVVVTVLLIKKAKKKASK